MKYKLEDVEFLVLVHFDSIQRLENALAVVKYLTSNFDTNICVWEVGRRNNHIFEKLMPKGIEYSFIQDYDVVLHRTKYINGMLRSSTSLYVAIWDVDVITPILQILDSVRSLREGFDFVYPYDKLFCDVTYEIRDMFLDSMNVDLLMDLRYFMPLWYKPNPVGGAFFANRESYIRSGGENENFYGWGIEDGERYNRWLNNNYLIKRIRGCIFHLPHPRGLNSKMNTEDSDIVKTRFFLSSVKIRNNEG